MNSHVGLDIRDLMRSSAVNNNSMFANSLTRNTAPSFHPAATVRSRPTSRPTDISFEGDVEHDLKMSVEHGRRAVIYLPS